VQAIGGAPKRVRAGPSAPVAGLDAHAGHASRIAGSVPADSNHTLVRRVSLRRACPPGNRWQPARRGSG
jgi:hypothetical protein